MREYLYKREVYLFHKSARFESLSNIGLGAKVIEELRRFFSSAAIPWLNRTGFNIPQNISNWLQLLESSFPPIHAVITSGDV